MSDNLTLTNPFPGLRPFEADEEHLFFGRDGQSDELLRRLRRSRFLAVLGTSGSGKSSLVRAGLLPALYGGIMTAAGSAWRVALFRPGQNPVGNLAKALSDPEVFGDDEDDRELQRTITEATLRRSALGLVEATRQARMPAHENLLVVVDQFEEIFRFRRTSRKDNSEDEAAAFVKLLLEAKHQTQVPIFIVITMRSDFLGDCSQFRDLPEAINEGQYLIPRMTRDQRREAITGPIAVGGGVMAPRLVNRLLNDVGDNPDQLPILQHSLMRTWDFWTHRRRDGEPIDIDHYEAVGTMSDALSRHADEAYNELPDERSRNIAEKLFKSLTEKGSDNREIRRPTKLREICAVADASEGEVIAVIERFRQPGRSFLMPPTNVALGPDSLIDISHESLIRGWERLRKWVEEEARSAMIYRRLAETAALHKEGSAGLWNDPDLALALRWRDNNRPNNIWAQHYNPNFDEAMGFLAASKAAKEEAIAERKRQQRAKVRRTRMFVGVLLVAFLISFWLAMVANSARVKAETQTRIAEAATKEAVEQRRIADEQKALAVNKAQEAETERSKAAEQAEIAEKERDNAEEQAEIARAAQAASERARLAAAASEANAIKARKDLQSEFLETRKTSLSSNSTILTLSNRLIELSAPREAAVWRSYYANALSMIGNHQKSVDESTAALDIEPDYVSVRAHRGYMYMLTHEPEKSVEDFNKVIEATPNSSLPYLNRAIVNGQLGRLNEARSDIDSAINLFRYGEYESLNESELAEDIQEVIGRNFLTVDDTDYYIALLYERANLQAAAGDMEFVKSLEIAHKQQESNATSTKGSALTALNWAWLHRRERSIDYGIFASEAALWEQAGRPDLARRYFNRFRDEHSQRANARYNQVSAWVNRQLARLPAAGGESPTQISYAALAVAADQLSMNENYTGALQKLNEAIAIAPKHKLPSLLLKRADVKHSLKDYPGSEQDAATALESAKSPQAYYYHARAMSWRDWEGTKERARADLKAAIKLDPTYASAISHLATISSDQEGLELYKRLTTIWPNGAWIYKEIAILENKLGRTEDARRSIATAIEIYNESVDFIDVRADIETSAGKPAEEVQRRQIEGYRQAIVALLRHNKSGAAFAYMRLSRLQDKLKLTDEALQSINKAIELDATNTAFYDDRSKLELALKKPEDEVLRGQVNGYARAIEALLETGKTESAVLTDEKLNALVEKAAPSARASFTKLSSVGRQRLASAYIDVGDSQASVPNVATAYRNYKRGIVLLSALVSEGNETAAAELSVANSKVERLREISKTTTTGELISARILTAKPLKGATREVTIDRGSDDGITADTEGSAWTQYTNENNHERNVKKIGKARILNLDKRSATVEVTMDNPTGDGVILVGDLVEFKANVPALLERSVLWGLAKYHINFITEDEKPLMGDFRELFANEDEAVVNKIIDLLVADVKKTAVVLANHELMPTKLKEGRFKDKTLRQALDNPTRQDVLDFLNYTLRYPATHYGKDVKFGRAFGTWVLRGTQQ